MLRVFACLLELDNIEQEKCICAQDRPMQSGAGLRYRGSYQAAWKLSQLASCLEEENP